MPFIPIVHSEDTERELADAHRRLHCIVFRPRNAVDTEPDIALDLLGTRRSRRLSPQWVWNRTSSTGSRGSRAARRRSCAAAYHQNAAIRTPAWASDDATAKTLVPMALIGAWHAELEADREIVSRVGGPEIRGYRRRRRSPASLSMTARCGLPDVTEVSPRRSMPCLRLPRMSRQSDLDRFFDAAEYVLSESDPALELPEKDRWAAALYGKKRDHSSALREGICETLVILSVHGNNLFQSRLGIDVESRVAVLIRKLLTPLTLEKLLSHDHDLPRYAEAAPMNS